jgi:hypothetical protein
MEIGSSSILGPIEWMILSISENESIQRCTHVKVLDGYAASVLANHCSGSNDCCIYDPISEIRAEYRPSACPPQSWSAERLHLNNRIVN